MKKSTVVCGSFQLIEVKYLNNSLLHVFIHFPGNKTLYQEKVIC